MDYQEKYQPQESSAFFYDGMAMRRPVPGTVARGELLEDDAFRSGRDAAGTFLQAPPVAVDERLLARGAERYGIYCAPCHTERGDGKGILYDKGVATASLHDPRIRALPDGEIFDVITNGKGLMQGYFYPVPAADRWAIVAHVRALQRRQLEREAQ